LVDQAAFWVLGVWVVWVGIGILALPAMRRGWRHRAQRHPPAV